jgi:polyisoprenoid-binding protein YceI
VTRLRRSPLALAALAVVALVGLAGAGGLAYLFLRPAAPAAVGSSLAPGGSASAAPLANGPVATLGPGGLAGTWTIDSSIGSFADFSSSFVGYRVNETFANNRANTAVGRTPDVEGTLVLDGTSISSVDVSANLASLKSDDQRRDGQLRRQAIETETFPEAAFKLTSAIDLGTLPAEGGTIAATAAGRLTLHGVTRDVEVPVKATLSGDVVTVTGSIEIRFADYAVQQPTSMLVLSIEDHGTIEFQLHFRHA